MIPSTMLTESGISSTLPAATSATALILAGGGGHAKVVADAARASGWVILGYLDDRSDAPLAARHAALTRLGSFLGAEVPHNASYFPAVGNNRLRERLLSTLAPISRCVVDPSAIINPTARLGRGTFVAPGAIVNADARIGAGCIINTGAIIEHDVSVADFAHLAPGTILGGKVTVGLRATVGLGARVLPGLSIGDDAIVGAGAVVTRHVPPGATVVGIPAVVRRQSP